MLRMNFYVSKFRRSALSFGASIDMHDEHLAMRVFRIGTVALLVFAISGCAALRRNPEHTVKRQSVTLDIWLMALTVPAVLSGRGAC
jgi:hypothetical protein